MEVAEAGGPRSAAQPHVMTAPGPVCAPRHAMTNNANPTALEYPTLTTPPRHDPHDAATTLTLLPFPPSTHRTRLSPPPPALPAFPHLHPPYPPGTGRSPSELLSEFGSSWRWSCGTGLVLPTPFGRFEANYCVLLSSQEHDRVKRGLQLGFAASSVA